MTRLDVDELRLALEVGHVPARLEGLPDRLARALRVAEAVGAPLVPAFDAARAARDDARELARAVEVATARARAVAGALLVAPAVLLPGLTRLLDLDLVAFYTSPAGTVVGVVGVALLVVGALLVARASARLTPRPRRPAAAGLAVGAAGAVLVSVPAGLLAGAATTLWRRRTATGPRAVAGADEAADLVATALAGGVGAAASLRVAAAELPDLAPDLRRVASGIDLDRPGAAPPPGLERVRGVLVAARRLGAPAAPALRALATELRGEALTAALAAAERLPVTLTFPTTLCLLPGTLLLVGAPLVASGLAAAGL